MYNNGCGNVKNAAIAAGAPDDIIGWIDEPTIDLSNRLMKHPKIQSYSCNGWPGMVKASIF
jgi:acetaldehyde dehydrogenase/alcohol dehydrogenase